MEKVLSNGFGEVSLEEMLSIDGGAWYDVVSTFVSGIGGTIATCAFISGSPAIATMSVASLAACGPIGWAVLGAGAVGGVVTGAATIAAAKE